MRPIAGCDFHPNAWRRNRGLNSHLYAPAISVSLIAATLAFAGEDPFARQQASTAVAPTHTAGAWSGPRWGRSTVGSLHALPGRPGRSSRPLSSTRPSPGNQPFCPKPASSRPSREPVRYSAIGPTAHSGADQRLSV
jgi:hypothetical protein